ncbi:MAG: Sua5/YciO/YrdC/YwlC family protein [Frankiales bacterium]|nr:Sua5/YciO/YrdC/YwlC family protein [Frankiales bacterium]
MSSLHHDLDQIKLASGMARYVVIHARDPQPRVIARTVAQLREDALIAYPTDSCYALDSATGADRIRRIRKLDDKHDFTLVCSDFAQLGQFVHLGNAAFRSIKSATPGPYTFIRTGTREVPRRLAHPKKKTVGVRIPDHPVVKAVLRELGSPLVSSTLLRPGHEEPMTDGWSIKQELDHSVDVVLDAGDCGTVERRLDAPHQRRVPEPAGRGRVGRRGSVRHDGRAGAA